MDGVREDDALIGWKAVAAALGVSTSTARRWTRELELPAYKLGGQVRASRLELGRWVRERRRRVGGIKEEL
ncbi:MAG: helix-turn-helix domain-containing protein [candidate division Zixibacteria bacterium]|nr:helix-turn-helix domain-containing protein [candidate division Zixibacteria bacterium]